MVATEPPQIRASMVKDFLSLLRDGRVARGAEILAMAEPGFVRAVEDASRLAWLDAAPVVRLADRASSLLGAERWRAVHFRVATELLTRPLFRPFFQGMGAVLGRTAATYCRIFPVVLQQAHRNFGTITSSLRDDANGAGGAVLRVDDCPPEGLSRGMLEVFAGTMHGLVSATTDDVRVTVVYTAGARHGAVDLRWSERT